MTGTPRLVVDLLDQVLIGLEQRLANLDDAHDRRFTKGSIDLIEREKNRLDNAAKFEKAVSIRHALRSVLGLTKGVLDIGASWTFEHDAMKQHFDEAMAEARLIAYGS